MYSEMTADRPGHIVTASNSCGISACNAVRTRSPILRNPLGGTRQSGSPKNPISTRPCMRAHRSPGTLSYMGSSIGPVVGTSTRMQHHLPAATPQRERSLGSRTRKAKPYRERSGSTNIQLVFTKDRGFTSFPICRLPLCFRPGCVPFHVRAERENHGTGWRRQSLG